MDTRPLVSVLIPAFNSEAYLAKALASATAQTYAPLEVILVDDGSTDRHARDRPVLWGTGCGSFEQPNRGSGAARNRGLDEASGQYIAFLDSDDLWHPRKIELQMAAPARAAGLALASIATRSSCAAAARNRTGRCPGTSTRWSSCADDRDTAGWLYLDLLRDSVLHTSTLLVSRDVLDADRPVRRDRCARARISTTGCDSRGSGRSTGWQRSSRRTGYTPAASATA